MLQKLFTLLQPYLTFSVGQQRYYSIAIERKPIEYSPGALWGTSLYMHKIAASSSFETLWKLIEKSPYPHLLSNAENLEIAKSW